MTKFSNRTGIDELLSDFPAEIYVDFLEEFFECWLTGNTIEGTEREYRIERLNAFKSLRKYLVSLKIDEN